jgi:hypothetical protein
MDSYPTSCQVSDILKLKSWLLPLLLDFMNELIPDEVKQVAIGCSIAQAARPRFVMSPVQLRLGVELDLKYRSKWLIQRLSKLGYSVSYDEVVRYRRSAVVSNQSNLPVQPYPQSFTQWIADNVDHNTIM